MITILFLFMQQERLANAR